MPTAAVKQGAKVHGPLVIDLQVINFMLSFRNRSRDASALTFQILDANWEYGGLPMLRKLEVPFSATAVRILPQTSVTNMSFRVELYGFVQGEVTNGKY